MSDVKVRISGEDEGVTQLLKALQKALKDVDREQDRNAGGADRNAAAQRRAAQATRASVDSFGALERTLQGLAGALAAQKLARFVLDAASAGNEIGKLAEKTGAGVEALSVLTVAAEDAELSQADLGTGLKLLQKALVDLRQGGGQVTAAFRALGLEAKDLEGLSTDQAFRRVADAMAGLRDGAGKTDVALKLFGRSGADLIPVLNALGGEGFAEAEARARSLGRVFSEEDVRAAQQFDDAMDDLTDTAKGVAATFARSVLPALSAVTEVGASVLQALPDSVQTFGATFAVAEGAIIAVTLAGRGLVAMLGELAAAEGAVAFGLSATGIGAVIVALGLLTAAVVAYTSAQERARQADAARLRETADAASRARTLADQYAREGRVLASATASAGDKQRAEERLRQIKAELIKLGPAYEAALRNEVRGYEDVAEAIRAVQQLQTRQLLARELIAESDVTVARERLAQAQRAVEGLQTTVKKGFPLPPEAMGNALRVAEQADAALQAAIATHTEATRAVERASGLTVGGPSPRPDVATPTTDAAAAAARLAEARAAIRRTLDAQREGLRSEEVANEIFYEHGARSLEAYFARRVELTRQGTLDEVKALQAERARLAAAPLPTTGNPNATDDQVAAAKLERTTQIADLTAKIAATEAAGGRAVLTLKAEQLRAQKALTERILADEAKVREARGDTAANAIAEIQRQGDALREALTQQGVGLEQRELRVRLFVDTLSAKAQLEELRRQADRLFAADDPRRADIQRQVAAHLITQEEGARRIAALERDRVPQLEAIVEKMRALAATLGPEAVASVEAYAARVADLGLSVDRVTALQRDLGSNSLDAAEAELSTFLGSTITQVDSLGDAFVSLASSIVSSIQRIVAELLAAQIVQGIAGLFAGGLSDSQVAGLTARVPGVGITKYAAGGHVTGPGTSTSDSIAAYLSDGEYVVRAAAVDRVGVDFLDALNGLRTPRLRSLAPRVPRFADGGLVTAGASAGGSGELAATFGLEEGLVLKHLKSKAGGDAVLETVRLNRSTIRAVLGIA